MNMHIVPRLLAALTVMLVITSVFAGPALRASAADNRAWARTESHENVLVQACDGYDLTTSYTLNRNYHRFSDYAYGLNLEQESVSFSGAIGNAGNGQSYAYDGQLTRRSGDEPNQVTITDLELRFEVGTAAQFTIASDRLDLDLKADPVAVIKTFVPYALRMDLCYLLNTSDVGPLPVEPFDPIARYAPGAWINVQTEPEQDSNEATTCADRARSAVPLPC
jgi:hypothetical protein